VSVKQLIRLPQVLQMVGLSRREVYRRIAKGTFPRAVPLGEQSVAWDIDEINAWITARIAARDETAGESHAAAA
jgi:prophage regulatory protein